MTERSFPWSGSSTGDCGPYSDDRWSDGWQLMWQMDRTADGVVGFYLNELKVTGTTSPLSVATGAALVDGKLYDTDAAVSVSVPTPSTATRIDRIVLRKGWSAQTVRVTRIAGTEGGGAPSLVQTDGTTWDIPLAQASITTGGIITVTDERRYLNEFVILLSLGSVQGGLTVGDYFDAVIPFEGRIGRWDIFADASGSCVIDVRTSSYSSHPTFTSIAASAKPTLSSAQKAYNDTLTGWTTDLARRAYVRGYCESVTTCKQVTVALHCRKRK